MGRWVVSKDRTSEPAPSPGWAACWWAQQLLTPVSTHVRVSQGREREAKHPEESGQTLGGSLEGKNPPPTTLLIWSQHLPVPLRVSLSQARVPFHALGNKSSEQRLVLVSILSPKFVLWEAKPYSPRVNTYQVQGIGSQAKMLLPRPHPERRIDSGRALTLDSSSFYSRPLHGLGLCRTALYTSERKLLSIAI